MIHAYNEVLSEKAADSLGRMIDFSFHSLHINVPSMLRLFTASGAANLFEEGDIRLICGMSGVELAYEVLERSGIDYERTSPRHTLTLSAEYWYGYALAILQWECGASFAMLIRLLPDDELINEYKNLRSEALSSLPWNFSEAERQAALSKVPKIYLKRSSELFQSRCRTLNGSSLSAPTELKKIRNKNGLSQSELAKASGVPLRTIQQYEQRQKDINHARAEYLIMLSKALNCEPTSLLERY